MPNPVAYNATTPPPGGFQRATITYGLSGSNYGANSPGGLTYYNSLPTSSAWVIVSDSYTLGLSTQGNAKPVMWSTGSASTGSLIRLINGLPSMTSSFTDYYSAVNWLQSTNKYFLLNNGYENIVTDGLVLNLDAGWWNSYPTTGTTWTDLSGIGNNGTLTNGPTFNSANSGSIVFDGVDDYAQITSPFGNVDWSSRAWSFSAWMKLNSLGDRCLVNLNSANSTDYIVTNVFYSNGGSYWYFIKNSASTQTNFTTPGGTFTTNEIFYFTMTYNGNGLSTSNINFYKNGAQVTTNSGGSAGLGNMSGLQIGGGNNYPMNGNVYNFLMYNRAISASEVLQNYNAQKSRFGL